MATDTTNVTNATAADLHESDIDHGLLTQSNAAPVVVQVPAGENVVRVQVTPGETIQLPFPLDSVVARLGDNGNLAVKVGDVTVILLGYAEATGQAEVTLLGTDARPMDVAAVLAATDPNLDIQTAAGPAAGPGAAGADNNGGLFAPFDPSGGIDGLNAVGGLDPTALNYNLIQRNFIELIEDDPTETDTVPIVIETTGGVVNEDDLTGNYGNVLDGGGFNDALARTEGQQSLVTDIISQFCWNPVFGNDSHDSKDYDGEDTKSGTPFGSAIIGYDPNGSDNAPMEFDREPLVFNGTANVNFGPDVPGHLVFNADTLTQLEGLGLTSHGFDLQYQQIDDTHIQGYIFDGECYTLIFTVAIGDDYPNPVGAGTTFDIFFILSGALDHPLPAGGLAADETNTLIPIFFQAIDSDGSTAGGQITFGVRDDIPVILENIDEGSALYHPIYAIDEDDLSPNGNGDNAPGDDWSNGTTVNGHIAVQFGADGPAAVDPLKFGVTDGQSTGLYTADGHEIFWGVADNQHVFGHIAGSTDPVFEVSIESNGNFAFTLHDALQHPSQDNPWTEGTTETGYEDNLSFSIPVIATDFDGDAVSTTIDLNIDDDMPVINVASETGFELVSDETVRPTEGDLDANGENGTSEDGLRVENDEDGLVLPDALKNPDFGAVIGGATGELADIFSYAAGADGEKSHAYTLDLVNIDLDTNSVHTTLKDTQSGQTIDLVKDPDGTIRGVVTIDEVQHTVFALSVDTDTGDVAFAQYRAIVHEPTTNNTLYDQVVALGSGYLTAGLTVTDNDGDTVSSSKDIGNLIRFEDDGPTVGEVNTLHFDDDLLSDGNPGGIGDDKPDADDLGGVQIDAEGHPYFEGTLPVDFGSDGGTSITITAVSLGGFNGNISFEGLTTSHATLSHEGTAFADIEILDASAGTYRVTQFAPFPHASGNNENNASVTFYLTYVDGDGDTVLGTLHVNFDDDTPTATAANYDTPVATEGGDPVFLQSLADFMAEHTSAGADGYKAGSLAFQPGSLGGTLDVVANPDDGGALWIRYTPPAVVNDPTPPSDETFNFSISDNDNDLAGSTVTVKVNDGEAPTLTAATGTVDEEGLEMGLPGTSYVDGSDVAGTATSAGGTLNVVLGSDPLAADNPFDLNGSNNLNGLKTLDGTTVLLAAPTSAEVAGKTVLTLIGYESGGSAANPADQVFVLTLNRDTGQWNFQLLQPVQHPLANSEDDRNISIGVSVSDIDGSTGNGTIAITIDDDSPTMGVNTRPMPPLTVDDTTLGSYATASFAGIFTGLAGADGQKGDIAYALNVKSPGVESGVIDVATGNKVYLFLDGGVVIGREGTDALDAQTGDAVFTVSVDSTGTVTLDQVRAVQHNDPLDPEELGNSAVKLAAADLITLTAAITDRDDDQASATANIAGQLSFLDDGPSIDDNDNVQLDDDALTGGIPNGTGDVDPDTQNITGVLAHGYGADGAGTTLLTGVNLPGVGGFTQSISPDGKTLTISQNGTPVLKVELSDTSGGSYTVTQLAPISHPAGGNENDVSFNVIYRVTDKDGDWVEGSLQIDVDDDTPTVSANALVQLDDDALTGGIANGTGDDANAVNVTGTLAHSYGADGAGTTLLTAATLPVSGGFTQVVSPDGKTVTISQNGTPVLKIELSDTSGGSYTVTQLAPISHPTGANENNVQFTVNYQVTDKDGDTVNGSMIVDVDDDTPTVSANALVQLDDDALTGGNANGTGDDANAVNVTGTLGHNYGADGAGTTLLTAATLPVSGGFTQVVSPDGKTVTISQNGTPVLKIELSDTSGGSYTVTQLAPISHPTGSDENNVQFTVNYQVTDKDGDTANGSMVVDVDDDTPTVSANAMVQLDDDALTGGNANGTGDDANLVNATGTLAHSYGADGAGTTLLTAATLPVSGGFTQVVSPDGKTVTISQNGTPVLKIELSDTSAGSYTVTQLAPISHPTGSDENNVQFTVNYQVTDKDGDTANGSMVVDVDDDTPTVSSNALVQLDDDALTGGIANGTGDDANAVNVTGTLAHSYGADGAGTTLLTAATLPVSGGFTQVVSPDGKTVTISQNGTPVLKVELSDTSGGSYTVTQLAPISHPTGSDENNVQFTVNYQVTDKDGDAANGSMVVDVDDDTPTVSANAMAQLDDDALTGGNANGTGDDANAVNVTGTLGHNYGADGAGTTLLTAATLPVSGGFTQVVSPDGKTLTISQNGTPVLKVELTDTSAGSYTVTQLAPISHPTGSDENNVQFTVNYQVTDKDGDTANGSMVVDVDDDTPTASNDSAGTVNTGGTVNVTDASAGVLANDHFGADGAKSGGGLIGVVAGNGSGQSTSGINTSIVTALGTLVLHADGTYTYTAKTNVSGTDYFTYTIEDRDGDRTTAVLSVNVADQAQGTISGAVTVYEDGMPAQNTGDFTKQSAGLGVTFTPADNEVVTSLTIKNLPTGWKIFDGNTLLSTGSGVDVPIDITLHPLANLKILPPEDNADGDITLNITATIQDPNGNLTNDINGTIAVTRDAVADKPTNVSISVTDAGGNGLFSVGEGGVVNVKASFGDVADSSESHALVVKIPAGFSLPDWNGSTWTGFPAGGVSVASVTGSAAAGWTVTFNVADNTTNVNMNLNVTNTAGVGVNAAFTVDAKAVEDQFSGTEPDNTNNTAITSASTPVVSARILNGELVTNTPSAQQGDQAMILTFVQDGQPLNAYSQVVVRDTQGQQGAVLADSGFNIDPSQHFNVALENPLEGHKIIVTDFNLEGVTLDVSGGNIQIEHEDNSGKPMGVYAQMSPNDGGTVIVTDSIDGTSGNNAAHNGTTGQDYLYGGAGNDTLNGNNDDDVLNGGVGNDTLNGDAGNDVLVWNGGLQTDASNPALGDTYHGGAGFDLLRIDQGALFNSTISGKTSIDFFPDQASDATVDLRGAHADGIEGLLLTEEAVLSGSSQSGSPALGTKVLLNASDVFNFSDNDTLYVIGSKGDVVDIDNATGTNTGSATWSSGAEVTPVAGGITFVTWTGTFTDAGGSHSVTLYVDKDVTVS
jgi:T1SS-143 domain-containing protein